MIFRTVLSITAFLVISFSGNSQSGFPPVDKSPMDIVYFPASLPNLKAQKRPVDSLVARVIYSRPKKEGRTIYGGIVPYGQVWRMGANEATEINFFQPVTIGGKKIPVGRYTLYATLTEQTWTFILNKETDVWGAFVYDPSKDIVRVEVPIETETQPVESLAMVFSKSTTGFNLTVAWDNKKASLPISL